MKVFAAGGESFRHKDDLKTLGFRWFREQKLWVKPEAGSDSRTEAQLNMMAGVRWEILDLPVEAMFRRPARTLPAETLMAAPVAAATAAPAASAPAAEPSPVSSLDRARQAAAAAKAATPVLSAPELRASGTASLAVEPKADPEDFIPERTRLLGRIDAMRLMLKEMEEEIRALANRVEL